MPMLVLADDQTEAAMNAADSDLRYLLSEVGVPDEVQAALYHRGFVSLRLFSGIDETRAEVRAALNAEIGLDHTAGNAERRYTALVLSAWETARTQQKANDENRAEARASMVPRPVPVNEHAMLREALENQTGRLRDYEVPAKSLIAAKLDDIETNMPRLEDLRDVASVEDGEADLLQGSLDATTGTFKMKAARNTVTMPKTAEELRLRHRRIGLAWEMARTKHRNRVWLQGGLVESYRHLSDHVLGKHVHGLQLPHEQRPRWELVLGYEQEVRKRCYQLLRRGEEPTLEDAMKRAISDPETMNLHFVVPLTTSIAASTGGGGRTTSSTTKPGQASTSSPSKGAKGGGRGPRPVKKLHVKTPDGRPLCFKYNNNNKCVAKNCNFVHQCQRCLGNHPKSSCNAIKADTAKAGMPPAGGAN